MSSREKEERTRNKSLKCHPVSFPYHPCSKVWYCFLSAVSREIKIWNKMCMFREDGCFDRVHYREMCSLEVGRGTLMTVPRVRRAGMRLWGVALCERGPKPTGERVTIKWGWAMGGPRGSLPNSYHTDKRYQNKGVGSPIYFFPWIKGRRIIRVSFRSTGPGHAYLLMWTKGTFDQ